MLSDSKAVITAIDYVLDRIKEARKQSNYDDLSDLGDERLAELVTLLSQAIERFAPPGSTYRTRANETIERFSPRSLHAARVQLTGVLKALRTAYEQDYLQTIQELVHADIFSDFLEMAEYLLDEGFKDPAAVLVGGVLEEHLRKLCLKHGIAIADPRDGRPRKSDNLNGDIAKQGVYDKLEQKNVTAWLDLRNKAAHGQYAQYDVSHVSLTLRGVRDFLTRYRA